MRVHILLLLLAISPVFARAGNSINNAECRVTIKVTVESQADAEENKGRVVYESSDVKVKKLVPYFMTAVMVVLSIFLVFNRLSRSQGKHFYSKQLSP